MPLRAMSTWTAVMYLDISVIKNHILAGYFL